MSAMPNDKSPHALYTLRRLYGISCVLGLVLCGIVAGHEPSISSAKEPAGETALPAPFQKLIPLHKPLGEPKEGDWLEKHKEAGQNYDQYVRGKPVRPDKKRRVICIQPLGEFSANQRKILEATAEYVGIYYQLPVRMGKDLPTSLIPEKARRKPLDAAPQILSTYVLNDLLKPRLPDDAVVYLALTSEDLWPGEGWNYVFGQASLGDRVGVWSIHRLGNADGDREAYQLILRRTLQVAAHETGHMFSIAHCTFYECCMCGSNSLRETDRQPLWLCPTCLAKVNYSTGADPQRRFKDLIAFAKAHDLTREEEFWQRSLATLQASGVAKPAAK
jgi:archaemetzincin